MGNLHHVVQPISGSFLSLSFFKLSLDDFGYQFLSIRASFFTILGGKFYNDTVILYLVSNKRGSQGQISKKLKLNYLIEKE